MGEFSSNVNKITVKSLIAVCLVLSNRYLRCNIQIPDSIVYCLLLLPEYEKKEKERDKKPRTKTNPNCEFPVLSPVKKPPTNPPPVWLVQAAFDGILAAQ